MQQLIHQPGGVHLRELLPSGQIVGADDIRVQACSCDWRDCRPGDVYVAMVGTDHDGHDHVDLALERGAVAVVSERLLPTQLPTCIVRDSRDAYGLICQRLAGQPDQQLKTFGVTGTLGKTVSAVLISAMLRAAGHPTGNVHSLEHWDGHSRQVPLSTALKPAALACGLARMVANGCSHAVVEVSSEALAYRHVAGLHFDAAVLTNLRRDHMDLHGSVKNYHRAKRRLFQHLKAGGFVVANADDPESHSLLAQLDVPVMTFGMRQDAELQGSIAERCPSEQTFMLSAGNETVPVRTRIVGDPHVYNCMAAAALGLVLGIDLATIVRGLESVGSIPGRLERLECGQPFSVYVDQSRTVDALAATLHTLRQATTGRVICVFGPSFWQDTAVRAGLGRVAQRGADVPVISPAHPGYEQPLQMAHDVLDGVDKPGQFHVIPDRAKAIRWALGEARPGDAVLIAGKGEEPYQVSGVSRVPMDDREIAKHWLYGYRPDPVGVKSTAILPMRLGCEWN